MCRQLGCGTLEPAEACRGDGERCGDGGDCVERENLSYGPRCGDLCLKIAGLPVEAWIMLGDRGSEARGRLRLGYAVGEEHQVERLRGGCRGGCARAGERGGPDRDRREACGVAS